VVDVVIYLSRHNRWTVHIARRRVAKLSEKRKGKGKGKGNQVGLKDRRLLCERRS